MRIDKTYRPELIDDECYVDAQASRLIVSAERTMVVLPVDVVPKERSGMVDVAGLRAARIRHPEDPQATLRIVTGAPAEDWQAKLPDFRRGARGVVTLLVNVSELKRVADAMGVVVVAITAQAPEPPFVIQPIDKGAQELGVLFPMKPVRRAAPKGRRRGFNLDGWADDILEEAGDHGLTTRVIG